jgi:hypothetical protein
LPIAGVQALVLFFYKVSLDKLLELCGQSGSTLRLQNLECWSKRARDLSQSPLPGLG